MKHYDEYEKTSRPGRPFSNSTEWEIWQWNVCLGRGVSERECVNDSDEAIDAHGGCPLILLSLDDKTPGEWRFGQTPRCTEKTTAAEQRRAEKTARDAAEKAALDAAHYPMFPEI